jgi:hypothetical protein
MFVFFLDQLIMGYLYFFFIIFKLKCEISRYEFHLKHWSLKKKNLKQTKTLKNIFKIV